MELKIETRLAYQVTGPASFLFNVAAVRNAMQQVRTENLMLNGAQAKEELMPTGQRLHRLTAGNSCVELDYQAVISVEPEIIDTKTLNVAPLDQLPLDALVFLYPSRFCQSDLLARLPIASLLT
jgi:hypothetical protein